MTHDNTERPAIIAFGGAIKSLGNKRYGGYLVKFTDPDNRDLTGEYFDAETDFCKTDFPAKGLKVLYQHGLDPVMGIRTVGEIDTAEYRADGIYVEFENQFAARYRKAIEGLSESAEWKADQYRLADEYERAIDEMFEKSKLAFSSGALPQGVQTDDTGHIRRWPPIEGSATPTPAMPRDTRIVPLKSLPVIGLKELLAKEAPDDVRDEMAKPNLTDNRSTKIMADNPAVKIDKERVLALLQEVAAVIAEDDAESMMAVSEEDVALAEDSAAELMAEEEDKSAGKGLSAEQVEAIIQKSVQAVVEQKMSAASQRKAAAAEIAKRARMNTEKGVSKVTGYSNPVKAPGQFNGMGMNNLKYAHMSASDMALGLILAAAPMKAMGLTPDPRQLVSEDYLRHLAHKAAQFAKSDPYKAAPFVDYRGEHAPHPEWVKAVNLANMGLKQSLPFKADELDASDITGQGLEWVGVFYDTDIWLRAREVRIYQELLRKGMMQKDIPQGFESAYFPTEGSDPIVYASPQANSVDASGRPEVTAQITPFSTGRVQLTPRELKLATSYTVILGEDSIVDVAGQVNYQINEKMQETIEQVMINSDTETAANTNINAIDGTPGTGLSAPYYLASNGFRKLPLVTATGQSRDAGNSLSLEDYRLTLRKMESPLRSRPDKMAFIIDADTETASLAIPEVATDDVRSTFATITSGVLRNVYGVDVFKSGFLLNSNTAGKVAVTTPANNIRGTISLIYAPYWGAGYKRNITIETARDILSGSNIYVASMRFGVIARGTNAAALSYNIQNGNG